MILDDALALWHGPALADLPDRTAESARWETRRLDVRRARLGAALALGHAEQSLPELTALCDLHPLDEPLHILRLRALRDAGRPAEALAAYESLRALLADRLGSDPGPELRALHGELLRPAYSTASPRPTAHTGGTEARTAPAPHTPAAGPAHLRARATPPRVRGGPGVPVASAPPATSAPGSPRSSGVRPTSTPSGATSPRHGW